MTTFVFPGQGSQKKGMGEKLFKTYKELTHAANQILGYSVEDLCIYDQQEKLGQTQYTQPALFVVDVLHYLSKLDEGFKPDYVMGHSLGEYVALYAAGVFSFETGLKLVSKRSELMAKAQGGAMLAVIGLSSEQIHLIIENNSIPNIDIANYNTYTQTIISGLKDDVMETIPLFESLGASMCLPLNVSGAFHSRYMREAASVFANYLMDFEFNDPKVPVIANTNADYYTSDTIKSNLVSQIDHSVQWLQSIESLINLGETDFIEVGPGMVLTGLINKIKSKQ